MLGAACSCLHLLGPRTHPRTCSRKVHECPSVGEVTAEAEARVFFQRGSERETCGLALQAAIQQVVFPEQAMGATRGF